MILPGINTHTGRLLGKSDSFFRDLYIDIAFSSRGSDISVVAGLGWRTEG